MARLSPQRRAERRARLALKAAHERKAAEQPKAGRAANALACDMRSAWNGMHRGDLVGKPSSPWGYDGKHNKSRRGYSVLDA